MSDTPETPFPGPTGPDPSALLMAALAKKAPELAQRVDAEFAPLLAAREGLREELLASGDIIKLPATPTNPPQSMCAIDGARVTEQMYAADLLVAVAAAADARHTPVKLSVTPSVWADIIRHQDGVDAIVQTAMGAQELNVAARAPHEIRILDGSFVTPIIALRQGLFAKTPEIRDKVADLLLGEWAPIDALGSLIDATPGSVLALAKSDSATVYARRYAGTHRTLGMSDRFLATQILEPGEMLMPRALGELAGQQVDEPNEGSAKVKRAAESLRGQVDRLKALAGAGAARTTYFKPTLPAGISSMGTGSVLRVEFLLDPNDCSDETAARIGAEAAAIISSDVSAPHLLEPFSQWMVDRYAKAISGGTKTLRERMIAMLPDDRAMSYKKLLASGYRTGK